MPGAAASTRSRRCGGLNKIGGRVNCAVRGRRPRGGRKSPKVKLLQRESGRKHMIKVKTRGNETAEQLLRRFKKACEKEGLTKDIKRSADYEKPSEKRRRRSRSKPKIRPTGRGG